AVRLVGLVPVPEDASLSTAAAETRTLRNTLLHMADGEFRAASRAVASYHPWQDLLDILRSSPPDLLLLEYPGHFERLGPPPPGILNQPVCDVAVVRGPWPQQIGEILVPLRGGPYAELSLRLSLALTHEHVSALHITAPSAPDFIEEPFRGLAAVLPRLRGVSLRQEPSDRPAETILQIAAAADLLLLGGSASASSPLQMGAMAERMFAEAECPTVVVKSKDPLPKTWTGLEGELAGAQAISLLVDRWFAENTYHAAEFDDTERLVRMKAEQGLTISLALPALNEEETVGQVIRTVKGRLMDEFPLLDEIVLIDSNSTDCTRQIAADLGVPVYIHQELLPELGSRRGKGEALWKSLLVTRGDILVWIDTDIVNIHPRFVSGVIGPLLANPALQFVKGFYRRPLREGGQTLAGGGGRVTELTARPLLNLFYPELSGVVQPLSGEYGGRRKALEQVPFFSGYGVEIGMLIDIFDKFGLSAIAQVDLLERVHHNQSLEALSKMSFTILQAVLRKLERRYNRSILEEVNKSMKLIRYEEGGYYLDVEEVAERERPPMITLTEYLEKS
ncbi:MAG TPA: glucosyl-3-phosphoglycerate synthase, partial [Anaerolineaceae bacterium]